MELTGPSIFSMMMKSAALAAGTMLLPAGGVDGVVSDGSGRDGITELYTFTAEFDVIADAFLYRNGGFHAAQITDGSEPETEEASGPEEGAGTGLIAFDPQSEAPDDVRLIFHAPDYAQEDILFVRTDEP